ncbi:MAG: hypothetical protein A3F31_05025 [Candidatus Levybacteria bacterium RIFCSPHIGHO2_12_FULL_38_12]|nr:MAG: hypothetical protein A2770_00215 [Candidatus Levybacteria bacterium RIFCSPHIGHO2_01_FULL_38_12]OGH21727.1 MAG: hypothetical protein A3D75_00880 [Candidatus Levybacteria bacterium RIFCSPHIGHO2_02_FULL_37_18]OGH22615.1 MAG: hypothetical protein A3F31_05025 [Candidatus Levybacteria bacterium RIFCSPHIGHO2_12_FULL_38_12]OGH33348.1 MAG: hypothetical protein A3A47_03830 [Candidatus Levybacteria bacterium RIFCSPLOWO2_01_FULL_37_20]OGH43737.1 MAG: hypothetical protein A3J14_04380 [Candidatus Lev
MKKRIAVIGGGIYGITAALYLADKYIVDLIEMQDDILTSASAVNQLRLHKGYHYPRSPETVISSLKSTEEFKKEYPDAVIDSIERFYCIAKENSLTPADKFIRFLEQFSLEFSYKNPGVIDKKTIDLCIKVKESSIDPEILYRTCWERLKGKNVRVLLNKKANSSYLNLYDHTVICTYASINNLLSRYKTKRRRYKYQLCEKIIVELPNKFKNKSIIIMDGPFFCIDPYGKSSCFLMGNVVHAVHQMNVGIHPVIPNKYKTLLNAKIIKNPPITNYQSFIDSAAIFIPMIKKARHVGSMYTIRAVLPNKEATDERLHHVQQINRKITTVFAGKIANCIESAKEVRKIIDSK